MKRWRGRIGYVLVAVVIAASTLGRAFPEIFTELHAYDDTGYMIALIRGFNAHGGLYTRVFSQYGPLYSQFYALLCLGSGVPATQVGIRWVAIMAWIAGSVAGGVLAFRLTGRVVFAALAQLFCFSMLALLHFDAGHPVGVCILCLAVAGMCVPMPHGAGFLNDLGGLPWRAVSFGAALGALALVKINLGVFALAAVGTAWAFCTPWDRPGRILRWVAGGLLCLLPILLIGKAWPVGMRFGFMARILATFAGALLVSERDESALTWREAISLALGMLAGWMLMWLVSIAGIVAAGSRPTDVWGGMVMRPLALATVFQVLPVTGVATLLAAALALCGAVAWRFLLPVKTRGVVARGRIALGLRVFFLALVTLWLMIGKGYLFVMPFFWIALLPSTPAEDAAGPFARRALVFLAAAQALSLYPVAGVQVVVPTYLGALVAVTVAAQVLAGMPARTVATPEADNGGEYHRLVSQRSLGVMAAVLLVGVFGVRTALAWRDRARMMPLDLPGSSLVRGEEWQVAGYTFLAANLRNQHSFLTLPGINSLYGWAEVDYPSGLNCTENFALLTPAEQRSLVEVGRKCGPVAIIYNEELFNWWVQQHGSPVGPLVDFQRRECKPIGQAAGYTLLRHAASDGTGPGLQLADLTFCALMERGEEEGERKPTGRISVQVSWFTPAKALLMDAHGSAASIFTPLQKQSNPLHPERPSYTLTLPNPEVLRNHSPAELCLRLCDEEGRRLTTVPFFVPADDLR